MGHRVAIGDVPIQDHRIGFPPGDELEDKIQRTGIFPRQLHIAKNHDALGANRVPGDLSAGHRIARSLAGVALAAEFHRSRPPIRIGLVAFGLARSMPKIRRLPERVLPDGRPGLVVTLSAPRAGS